MNTTKKLFVLTLVAVLAVVSFVPSTFSWYSHSASLDGQNIWYHGSVPVSVKSTKINDNTPSAVTMTTYLSDANEVTGDMVAANSGVSIAANAAKKVQYYKTVFENTGSNDVMVDMCANNMVNNADFIIGNVSPTLNEKAFASRASRETKTPPTFRVYFKTYLRFRDFWSKDDGVLYPNNSGGTTTNDINIGYVREESVSGVLQSVTHYEMMHRCEIDDDPAVDENWSETGTYVYYYDLPTDIDHFFFFNHYYFKDINNKNWNITPDIKDKTAGNLYYLNGGSVDDGNFKTVSVKTDYKTELCAFNQYYSSVGMSMGSSVYADISLNTVSEDAAAVPDYYGTNISYSVPNDSGTSDDHFADFVSINRDGLVKPLAYTDTSAASSAGITDANPVRVRTTITGKFGDTLSVDTVVKIPSNIAQVQIIKNVTVPKATVDGNTVTPGKTEVIWYALNNSDSDGMTTGKFYFTL